MKTFKSLFATLLICATLPVLAQTDKATTERIVKAQDFVFVATRALPLSSQDVFAVMSSMNHPNASGSITLTGAQYDLRINKDSVVAFLPYYGRAYQASMNPDDAGIKFKSKDFKYVKKDRKKGGWSITIEPKDVKDNQRLTLYVSENGYGTLNVLNNNRQSISFNGFISEPKAKK
ncbi:hypothetical protein IWX76_001794 [Pedobacter sp. CAN_A7]|uniref:DUF4251 domain-containing protein n=1 Tax=Pedobacter sp. CAN_A7 TaxID=2787722 RepID=UPI0018CA9004